MVEIHSLYCRCSCNPSRLGLPSLCPCSNSLLTVRAGNRPPKQRSTEYFVPPMGGTALAMCTPLSQNAGTEVYVSGNSPCPVSRVTRISQGLRHNWETLWLSCRYAHTTHFGQEYKKYLGNKYAIRNKSPGLQWTVLQKSTSLRC